MRIASIRSYIALVLAIALGPASSLLADDFEFLAERLSCEEAARPDGNEKKCTRNSCCCGHLVDWSTVPVTIRPMPRLGNFPFLPAGPGYYSAMDWITGNYLEAPPKSGYPRFALMPPSFFDADWRYVESIPYSQRSFVEKLKRIPVTDCLTFSTGGQIWDRFTNEYNARLTEFDNSYNQVRLRMYGDLMYGDIVRLYGEYIWADTMDAEFAPLPIDEDLGDILNLFIDLKLFEYAGAPVYARVGRQELLFGSQRLISTLDWANTRRTFEGVRFLRNGEKWDFDAFYTAFVPPKPNSFDQADEHQMFGGAWLTNRPQKGHTLDFYYLYFDDDRDIVQQGIIRDPTQVNTLGTRYAGDKSGYLWDCELALQLGDQGANDLVAGMATVGAGRKFDHAWSPTLWAYYDYASGDPDPNSGVAHTFNQLYPFGHYYLGWTDQVGRQNIHDANLHLQFYPQKWITVWLQYHHFWLNHSRDALYNGGGVAIRRDPTGAAGNDVGDEFDVVVNFHLTDNSDILFGYAHLFGARFLQDTATPTLAANNAATYLMYQRRW